MAVSRTITRKAPSQAPKDFFQCTPSRGTGKAPEKSVSGPQREKIFGKKALSK